MAAKCYRSLTAVPMPGLRHGMQGIRITRSFTGSDRATFIYPTQQQAGTIWFHDHAFGITRLNVYAGMAGVYPIVDPANPACCGRTMPAFPQHDIPLIIQDRSFDTDGQIFYNLASNPQPNPTVHPFWIPEFIGDVILRERQDLAQSERGAPAVPLPPPERVQRPVL